MHIIIPGKPFGKQRSRSTRAGHHYTPGATIAYESLVRLAGQAAMSEAHARPLEGPVRLRIVAQSTPAASWSRKKRQEALAGAIMPTGKPDLSNCVKAIEDGLNGVCYRDDSQVCVIVARKQYGDIAQVDVEVSQC